MKTPALLSLVLCLLVPSGFQILAQTTLIPTGAVWKYLDNGTDQGTAWRAPGFNDASWASGPAELGYGDGFEATTNSYGLDPANKYVTTYFRHSFNLASLSGLTNLQLRLLRDDGAIVYLNGVEIFRSNLPTGTVTSVTLAQAAALDDGTYLISVDVPVNRLLTGNNLVAVEMHQNSRDSSDLSFNLALIANVVAAPPKLTFHHWEASKGGNGHFYEVVLTTGITWDSASAAATNRGGYLATVTSSAENDFLFLLIKNRPELWQLRPSGDSWGPWLGGIQPSGSVEPGGGWKWITGEPFIYTSWAPGEPSNTTPGEDKLTFHGPSAPVGNTWNDKAGSDNRILSYIIEYDQPPATFPPIMEFTFNETGNNAVNSGVDNINATFVQGSSTHRDFHSPDGAGVSGLPGDRSFDNSISSGMGSAGAGGRANTSLDPEAVDDLLSFTLQGWIRADGASIQDLARLLTKQASSTGFLLLGTDGNLNLEVNNVGTTSTGARYADIREWIFFAVTYDGTITASNVRFYKGSRTNGVVLLETRTLNQGRALGNSSQVTIGNANSDGSLMRPFDGWLDNVRVFGSKTNSAGVLSLQQLEWVRNMDLKNASAPIALSIATSETGSTVSWPVYPGGFRLEFKEKLTPALPWTPVVGPVQNFSNQHTVSLTLTGATRFFRLAR